MEDKILIVDDDLDIIIAIETILHLENYSTIAAQTGTDGISIAKKERPSLILLDYMLPDMTGRNVVESLRENQTLINTPIILISATHGLRHLVRDLPIQDIIEKPFDLETLTSTVAEFTSSS